MITIYLDGSAVSERAAAAHLAHLVDAGHEVVLVAPAGHPSGGLLGSPLSFKGYEAAPEVRLAGVT